MSEKVGMGMVADAAVLKATKAAWDFEVPFMMMHAELHVPPGASYHGWTEDMTHNAVQSAGKTFALNRIFGPVAVATAQNTWFLGLHSNAGTDTTFTGPNAITSAEISGYTTAAGTSTWRASVTFGSTMPQQTTTFGQTFVFFTAAQQTVSGPFLVGGTTSSTAGQATGTAGTAGAVLYAVGAFGGGAKTVNNNDTLQVTVTLSVA